MTRLRILWWRWRYGWRIYFRSSTHKDWIGLYWTWCLGECSRVGFEVAVQNEGSVEAALKLNPVEDADMEMSYWND